jgi:acyl-CoA synthetase (AMP-forming)/AMP-acid ligase II
MLANIKGWSFLLRKYKRKNVAVPSKIVLSHKNLIANVKQVTTMLNPSLNDKIMGTLPNFHSFGLTVCTLMPQLEGIPVIILRAILGRMLPVKNNQLPVICVQILAYLLSK